MVGPVRTIYFDFGNVIAQFDHRRATRQFVRLCDRSEAEIFAAIYGGQLEDDFEAGRIGGAEFVNVVTTAIGYRGSADEFVRAFVDIFTPNPEVIALLPRLAARGHRLVLASNTNALHYQFFRRTFADALTPFHALGVSFEAGARKPHPDFFAHCQRLAGGTAAEALFIDDIRLNVEGARAFGWDAVQYTDFPALTAALRERGVDI
jgi:putative hydrolase of the HAD superfamily